MNVNVKIVNVPTANAITAAVKIVNSYYTNFINLYIL